MWVAGPSVGAMTRSLTAAAPGHRLALESLGATGQLAFADLGVPLAEVTFVVVDLETTGGRATTDAITEIGAVKVRGGSVEGEFQTLVNPGAPIPALITALTGITTAMVQSAPRLDAALSAFLQWADLGSGAVLVAHNARFDVGFLKAAASRIGVPWPGPLVVDTLVLARRALPRDQVRNYKLSTLAAALGASTTPSHRALDDARATVDVLHRLLEILAPLGLTHREDLRTIGDPVPAARRRKAHLAEAAPRGPGVYQFIGPAGEVLYVGVATDLHSRVRSYFTAAEKRRRIAEMVELAVEVRTVACATLLEAQVRELRLIAELQPPYNVRSRGSSHRHWVRLASGPRPRVAVTRTMGLADVDYAWGPFPSHRAARAAADYLALAVGLRGFAASSPHESARRAKRALAGDLDGVLEDGRSRLARLVQREEFEGAQELRDTLHALSRAARSASELRVWFQLPHVVAAAPGDAGWELAVVRYGRLAASGVIPAGASAVQAVADAVSRAQLIPPPQNVSETLAEETALILRWLDRADVRLAEVDLEGPPLALPVAARGALGANNEFLRRSWTTTPIQAGTM